MHTLMVDDSETLIDAFASHVREGGIEGVQFSTNLGDARTLLAEKHFDRIVTDNRFEDEAGSGVELLDEVARSSPNTERVLLTGQEILGTEQARLNEMGATVLRKGDFSEGLLENLFTAPITIFEDSEPGEAVDLAVLRLELEEVRTQKEAVDELNNLLIQDIIDELAGYGDRNMPRLMIGDQALSVDDVERHLRGRTEVGRELIRLHHQLNKRLRKG